MLKRHLNANKPRQGRSMQSNKILKLMHSWQQSIAIDSITSTFAAAGIISEQGYLNQRNYCSIDLSVSIHLTELENLIEMQSDMTSTDPPNANAGTDTVTDPSVSPSLFRPTLYPPGSPWITEKPIRVSIELPGSGTQSPKNKTKNASPTKLSVILHQASAASIPQRQLTIAQTGWGPPKKSGTGEDEDDASTEISEQMQSQQPYTTQLVPLAPAGDNPKLQ
jgi:hypothetical protein